MNLIINTIKQYWVFLSAFMLIAIATLSLWPVSQLPDVPGSDKTHHFVAYGLLIFPLALRKPKYWLCIALGFAIFSGGIELIQPYVNRYGEWLDLAANVGGLVCGVILANIILFYKAQVATSAVNE